MGAGTFLTSEYCGGIGPRQKLKRGDKKQGGGKKKSTQKRSKGVTEGKRQGFEPKRPKEKGRKPAGVGAGVSRPPKKKKCVEKVRKNVKKEKVCVVCHSKKKRGTMNRALPPALFEGKGWGGGVCSFWVLLRFPTEPGGPKSTPGGLGRFSWVPGVPPGSKHHEQTYSKQKKKKPEIFPKQHVIRACRGGVKATPKKGKGNNNDHRNSGCGVTPVGCPNPE